MTLQVDDGGGDAEQAGAAGGEQPAAARTRYEVDAAAGGATLSAQLAEGHRAAAHGRHLGAQGAWWRAGPLGYEGERAQRGSVGHAGAASRVLYVGVEWGERG